MKLVDSKKEQLDYGQILHVYHSNEKQDDKNLENFTIWMAATAASIARLNAEGAIIGNTFFLYKRGPEGREHQAVVWAMNADTLQNMVDNVTEGITRILNMGVTEILAFYSSPAITRVMRQAFRKIADPDDDLSFEKLDDGTTIMIMKLSGDSNV